MNKTNLKPLIDEGYRYFAIDDSEDGLNGAIMGKFKVYDDAKNFYMDTLYVIYTADRLVKLYPDFFEIKEESASELDLTQVLKDCPEGTKLYSPLFGEVTLFEIIDTPQRIIKVRDNRKVFWHFKEDGRYYNIEESECLLFPSKGCRDWSTFKVLTNKNTN